MNDINPTLKFLNNCKSINDEITNSITHHNEVWNEFQMFDFININTIKYKIYDITRRQSNHSKQ